MLSLLPPYEGKSVLQIGAGIGPLTGELAKKAGQVVAVDFTGSVTNKVKMIIDHQPHLLYFLHLFLQESGYLENCSPSNM